MSYADFATGGAPFAGGTKGGLNALSDAALRARFLGYRLNVAKRYRVIGVDDLARVLPEAKGYVSTKLDGELWFLVKRGDDLALCAYNGRVLHGIKLLDEARARLAGAPDLILAGELIAVADNDRARVSGVARALHDDAEAERLRFFAFDLLEVDGKDQLAEPYGAKLASLRGWLEGGERVGVMTTVEADVKEVSDYYKEWVTATSRFEGAVFRTDGGVVWKLKPTFTLDAVIIAFGTRITNGQPELRELQVALLRDDGTWHLLGSVGGGLTSDERGVWYQRLSKLEVPSRFRLANRDGALCRFVPPQIVVELRCSDLLVTDADEIPNTRVRLNYDPATGWSSAGAAPIPAMLFPVVLRERTDKSPDRACVGIEQVTQRVSLEDAAPVARSAGREAAVVDRRVYVKGDTAVRKVVLLETGGDGRLQAPYVVYGTDYSVGRAEPLKATLKTASTREKADALVEAWLAENVKRGWVALGAEPEPVAEKPKRKKKGEE